MTKEPAPLAGVRVLDVSRFVSGPLCTFLLASMGAEVISVESPRLSTSRRLPPFAHPDGGSSDAYVDGAISIPFLKRGRGKRSVALDVTVPDGASLARRLAMRSDVLVENSRSDDMTRFGLGYEQLAAANGRLVYCAISGYGYDAPDRPAMDNIVQAASGVMAKTGFADGPPLRAGITVADHTSAAYAALGILAALRQRDATGQGQLVDVAMLDVLTASVWDEPVDHYAAIGMPPRTGNADGRGAPINTYRCADGWVALTCTSDRQWHELCDLMERDDSLTKWPTVRERAGAKKRSTRQYRHGPRTVRCVTSKPRYSRSAFRPVASVTQSKRPTTRTSVHAGSSTSSDIRARPSTVRAGSSVPRCRSRSQVGSRWRPPKC